MNVTVIVQLAPAPREGPHVFDEIEKFVPDCKVIELIDSVDEPAFDSVTVVPLDVVFGDTDMKSTLLGANDGHTVLL